MVILPDPDSVWPMDFTSWSLLTTRRGSAAQLTNRQVDLLNTALLNVVTRPKNRPLTLTPSRLSRLHELPKTGEDALCALKKNWL